MKKPIPTLVLLPPSGPSTAEQWVSVGLLAAAKDLVLRLLRSGLYEPVFVLAAEIEQAEALYDLGATPYATNIGKFHFGRVFEGFLAEMGEREVAYFGGGSGPLLSTKFLTEIGEKISLTGGKSALVNNYHSSDWIVLRNAALPEKIAERLPADNMLGWVMDHEAKYRVEALSPCAATRADIDTPVDLILLYGHPDLGEHLRDFLRTAPSRQLDRIDQLRQVLKTPASQLTIIGRCSSQVLMEVGRRSQIWTRVFSEERGMVASGRLKQGEVQSILAEFAKEIGVRRFVDLVSEISDAVLWDTRVWMAARGAWPSAAERFALDLGWMDEIADPTLTDLARSFESAEIPIVHGGHGVVAGGLYAVLETLEEPTSH